MDNPVLIFGAKGIGPVALDIFRSNDVIVFGFLDEDASMHGKEINDISVLGNPEDDGFLKLIGKKCVAFVAVDDPKYRKSLVKLLNERRKVMPVNAIHGHADISPAAAIGHGNFINTGVKIGPNSSIGNHCILHNSAIIDFNVKVGDFVQIGAGSIINAEVTLEEGAFIGTGVTIVSGVTIGKNARVGAGSVVIADVAPGKTVFGNPADIV